MIIDQECQNCGSPLIAVVEQEDDGFGVFDFVNYDCGNGCAYPETPDDMLTAEELAERGKVDTGTEFGIVRIKNNKEGAVIL